MTLNSEPQSLFSKIKGRLTAYNLQINLIAIFIAIIAVAFSVILSSRSLLNSAKKHNFQINSLISEIGESKKNGLEEKMENKIFDLKIRSIEENLAILNQKLAVLSEKEQTLIDTKNQLVQAQNELDSLRKLNRQKDSKISLLAAVPTSNLENPLTKSDESLDILILGTNGGLTDTIMTASVNSAKNSLSLISFPRDLYVQGRKINEIYHRFGIERLAEAIFEISNIRVEKFLVFDFQSFVGLIDEIGGIDLVVEKSIYDNAYPGPNRSYSVFSLDSGPQHLNGEIALKYARSRKSSSDFDRARRQQQIVVGVVQKAKALDFFANLNSYVNIFNQFSTATKTNVDALTLLSWYAEYKDYKIQRANVLSTADYLYSTHTEGGQYILLPKSGNYEDIKNFVKTVIEGL